MTGIDTKMTIQRSKKHGNMCHQVFAPIEWITQFFRGRFNEAGAEAETVREKKNINHNKYPAV